eukprot:TRINITY_DN66241_c11_g1_i3.p1 TRINITY_DN66241_c11_g1~~TRINITY_DN66241_c11_g1_i3.p1  ORF type:complete len:629 (+),score=275.17 TRINITY_DN66241_c11_g1_i3:638-2524(+)
MRASTSTCRTSCRPNTSLAACSCSRPTRTRPTAAARSSCSSRRRRARWASSRATSCSSSTARAPWEASRSRRPRAPSPRRCRTCARATASRSSRSTTSRRTFRSSSSTPVRRPPTTRSTGCSSTSRVRSPTSRRRCWALDLLNRQPKQAQNGSAVMNFVVLLTDGCVDNERDICNAAMQKAGDTRVLTFGIGKYCNWFFLRMLALATRGFNENVVYAHDIGAKITQLMNMASAPVLTDVGLGINVPNCELYPSPIPDLFVGAPLTIAGKFEGQFPPSVTLQGKLCNGQQFTQEVRPAHSQLVPVEKVFLKQRLDMLTSRQWLEDSKKIEQEIVQISTENSFPTPYTTMVAYETTVEKKAEQERKDGDTGETKPDEGDKVEQKQELPPQDSKGKHTAAKAAAVMVGGAFLVGAAVYTFGDPAATLANASSLVGGIGDFFGGGIGAIGNLGNCCGSLVECFSCGSCGDCGDLFGNCGCGGCGELLDGAGSCLSETFNCCGGACGSAFEACSSSVQDIFSSCDCGVCDGCKDLLGNCSGVGEICSTICSPIGSCIGAVGGAIGSICGDLIGTIGDCVGSCDCGALCGSVGGLCSSVGDCAGSVCGSLGDCVGSCDCGSITDILGDICDVLD